jgi:hypothetical protein
MCTAALCAESLYAAQPSMYGCDYVPGGLCTAPLMCSATYVTAPFMYSVAMYRAALSQLTHVRTRLCAESPVSGPVYVRSRLSAQPAYVRTRMYGARLCLSRLYAEWLMSLTAYAAYVLSRLCAKPLMH